MGSSRTCVGTTVGWKASAVLTLGSESCCNFIIEAATLCPWESICTCCGNASTPPMVWPFSRHVTLAPSLERFTRMYLSSLLPPNSWISESADESLDWIICCMSHPLPGCTWAQRRKKEGWRRWSKKQELQTKNRLEKKLLVLGWRKWRIWSAEMVWTWVDAEDE